MTVPYTKTVLNDMTPGLPLSVHWTEITYQVCLLQFQAQRFPLLKLQKGYMKLNNWPLLQQGRTVCLQDLHQNPARTDWHPYKKAAVLIKVKRETHTCQDLTITLLQIFWILIQAGQNTLKILLLYHRVPVLVLIVKRSCPATPAQLKSLLHILRGQNMQKWTPGLILLKDGHAIILSSQRISLMLDISTQAIMTRPMCGVSTVEVTSATGKWMMMFGLSMQDGFPNVHSRARSWDSLLLMLCRSWTRRRRIFITKMSSQKWRNVAWRTQFPKQKRVGTPATKEKTTNPVRTITGHLVSSNEHFYDSRFLCPVCGDRNL